MAFILVIILDNIISKTDVLMLLLTVIILIISIALWSENNEYGAVSAALGVEWSQLYISTRTVIVTILVYSNHHHFQQHSPLFISIHIVTENHLTVHHHNTH